MVSGWELWACAHAVLRDRGDAAGAHVAARVADLAGRGDDAGVATWRIIGGHLERLRQGASERVH